MGTFLLIIALLIAIVAVIFALQNTAMITVAFFAWQFEQSLALVLIITVILGVLIGVLTILPGSIRSRWRVSNQKKKLDVLEKSLLAEQTKREEVEQRLNLLQNPPSAIPEPVPPAADQNPSVEPPAAEPQI